MNKYYAFFHELNYYIISMETLQAFILSAIKAIRSSKKRADELTIHKFIKTELQSITNEEITDTFKTLCEMR